MLELSLVSNDTMVKDVSFFFLGEVKAVNFEFCWVSYKEGIMAGYICMTLNGLTWLFTDFVMRMCIWEFQVSTLS